MKTEEERVKQMVKRVLSSVYAGDLTSEQGFKEIDRLYASLHQSEKPAEPDGQTVWFIENEEGLWYWCSFDSDPTNTKTTHGWTNDPERALSYKCNGCMARLLFDLQNRGPQLWEKCKITQHEFVSSPVPSSEVKDWFEMVMEGPIKMINSRPRMSESERSYLTGLETALREYRKLKPFSKEKEILMDEAEWKQAKSAWADYYSLGEKTREELWAWIYNYFHGRVSPSPVSGVTADKAIEDWCYANEDILFTGADTEAIIKGLKTALLSPPSLLPNTKTKQNNQQIKNKLLDVIRQIHEMGYNKGIGRTGYIDDGFDSFLPMFNFLLPVPSSEGRQNDWNNYKDEMTGTEQKKELSEITDEHEKELYRILKPGNDDPMVERYYKGTAKRLSNGSTYDFAAALKAIQFLSQFYLMPVFYPKNKTNL